MSTDAQALIDAVEANISDIVSASSSALGDLQNVVDGGVLGYFTYSGLTEPDITAPGAVKMGTIKDFQRVTLDASVPTPFSLTGNLPQLAKATLDDAGGIPTVDQSLLLSIAGQFESIISSGGANVQGILSALFNLSYERLLQVQRDALELTGARTGAKGCRYPNSMTKALQSELTREFTWQQTDLLREVDKLAADTVQRNLNAAMSTGASVAGISADIGIKLATLALDARRLVYEKFKVEVDANLAEFKASMDAILASYDAQSKNYSMIIEYIKAKQAEMGLNVNQNMNELEASVKTVLAQLEGDKTIQELLIAYDKMLIDKFSVESGNLTERGKAVIAQMRENNSLRLSAIETLAKGYVAAITTQNAQGVAITVQKT